MLRVSLRFAGCLLCGIGLAGAGPGRPADFRNSRPIVLPELDVESLVSVPLDSAVFSATRDGFPDVRVLRANGESVPFRIRRVEISNSRPVVRNWTAIDPQFKPLEPDGMELRIALRDTDQAPTALNLVTPLQDFEQQVDVFAVTDSGDTPLVEAARIFDFSQYMDVRQTTIPLPSTTARQFRIVVKALNLVQESQYLELTRTLAGDSEEKRTEAGVILRRPFRLDRIEFSASVDLPGSTTPVSQSWPVEHVAATTDPETGSTHVRFSCRREPLTTLTIRTDSRNSQRNLEVFVSDSAPGESVPQRDRPDAPSEDGSLHWRSIATASISRVSLQHLNQEHLTVSVPETRATFWKLVISNGDSPPLKISGIDAAGSEYRLTLLANPGEQLELQYGSEEAAAPQHDTVALDAADSDRIQPLQGELGVVRELSVPEKPVAVRNLFNNPILLGSLVLVLVAGLGWALFQAGKRIGPHSGESSSG